MIVVALVLAGFAGLLHVYIFAMESLFWSSIRVRRIFGVSTTEQLESTTKLAFNQGFYNLFLSIGTALGLVFALWGDRVSGWTLLIFCCSSMVAAALVLASTGRRYLRGALIQGTIPACALLSAGVATFL